MAHPGSPKKAKTYLLGMTVNPQTLATYKKHVKNFLQWCADNDGVPSTYDDLDDIMVEYFHHLYESGSGLSAARATVNGYVCFDPRAKFAAANRALKGWDKTVVHKSYPPLTWELAVAIAVQLARSGKRREAIGLLLGFDCLLRVSELCGLERRDVADDRDARISGEHKGMVLRFRATKTFKNLWVKVMHPEVRQLVRGLVDETKSGGGKLFPFSTGSFRRSFKAAAAELGLSERYVPHSLRHGGATRCHHVLGMSIEDVMERGRWASSKSTRRYIQAGVAMLLEQEAPSSIVVLGRAFSKNLILAMALAQKH